MSYKRRRLAIILVLIAHMGAQLACASQSDRDKAATVDALAAWLAPSATAEVLAEDDFDETLVTAEADATQQARKIGITQTALADLEYSRAATATAFAPILAELPKYGVDPTKGEPGWIHPPVTLELEGYMQNDSSNYYIFTIAEDFAISADITWNTEYGTSGCGFVLRSDGDDEKPNQYMLLATRAGNGHVVFMIMAEGNLSKTWDFYPAYRDEQFDWRNDSTNRLTIVGRGTEFSLYTNETLIGEFDVTDPPLMIMPPTPELPEDTTDIDAMTDYLEELDQYEDEVANIRDQFNSQMGGASNEDIVFERGFVAFIAMSESGRTVCTYDNAWLWLIDPGN